MRKKAELIFMLLLLAGLAAAGKFLENKASSGKAEEGKAVVVIDCGHGGNDPGKVGAGGVLEKDVNLEIGKLVCKRLEKKGYEVIMTREEDEALADVESDNIKVQDMKNRVKVINGAKPGLAVSIHQNSYPDPDVCGAQVFYYSESAEGKAAAEIMQEALLEVDAENTRKAKANNTYYILKRTEPPIVIVECGFLSNPEEERLLSDEGYQETMAEAITSGVEKYLESE